jgi:hypothetical protein
MTSFLRKSKQKIKKIGKKYYDKKEIGICLVIRAELLS